MKLGFFAKIKATKLAISFAKHYPKLALLGAISGVLYYGYNFMETQHAQLKALQESVVELKTQNQAIRDANQAIVADMQAVKQGMETYQDRLIEIREQSRVLSQQFANEKFRKELQSNIKAAEKDFNGFFNQYMESFNEESRK